jgi:phosphoribosylanthranilate isomerase
MLIKVCGLTPHPDNETAVSHPSVTHVGFIFHEPSPRFVRTTFAVEGKIRTGVCVNKPVAFIQHIAYLHQLQAIQLHGDETPAYCAQLRKQFTVIKAISVHTNRDIAKAHQYEDTVDVLLFDTGGTQRGGNGIPFDWQFLNAYLGNTPFILSGGIGLEQLPALQAFSHPRWVGIDLNSRFELAPGIKSPERLHSFLTQFSCQHLHNPTSSDFMVNSEEPSSPNCYKAT